MSPLASLRASRALLWPQGSRRGEEVGFPLCQLLSPGALLLVARLFPRSFSIFMVLNLPFFLPSDSASFWNSAAKNKGTQPGKEGSSWGRAGQDGAVASVTEQVCDHQGSGPSMHQATSLYPISLSSLRSTPGRTIWNL